MFKRSWKLLIVVVVLFCFGSCEEPDPIPSPVSDTIGPSGELFRAPHGVLLEVPVGSLDLLVTFQVTLASSTPLPKDYSAITPIVRLGPANVTFKKGLPARLSLPLLRQKLPGGHTFRQIQLFFYDSQKEKWLPHSYTLEDATQTISGAIEKTGIFAGLLGPPSVPEPPIEAPIEPLPEEKISEKKKEAPPEKELPEEKITEEIPSEGGIESSPEEPPLEVLPEEKLPEEPPAETKTEEKLPEMLPDEPPPEAGPDKIPPEPPHDLLPEHIAEPLPDPPELPDASPDSSLDISVFD